MADRRNKDMRNGSRSSDTKTPTDGAQPSLIPEPQAKDQQKNKHMHNTKSKSSNRTNQLDRRRHYALFGDVLPPLDYTTAQLVQQSRKMDDFFETGGILKNDKHDYLLLEKLGPTEFKVSETKADKIYFLKVEASKMPVQGPKLARHVHIMLRNRNTNPLFRRHFLKMTDRGIIEGSYNFILTRYAGQSLEDLRRKGPQGQQFTSSTALRLCVQTFQAIHDVHLCHFVHRDIQPKNFLVGIGSRANIVYVVGFGLAEQYFPKKKKKHPWDGRLIKFPWLNLTFQSRSFHRGDKIYRQHDLESWLYMCYYFFNSNILPWRYWNKPPTSEREIYNFKRLFFRGAFDSQLFKYSPQGLVGLRIMVDREHSPNPIDYSPYAELLLMLKEMLCKTPVDWNAPFELELPKHLKIVPPGAPENLKKPIPTALIPKTYTGQKVVVKNVYPSAVSVAKTSGQPKKNQSVQEVVSCEECKKPFGFGRNNLFYNPCTVEKDQWIQERTDGSKCGMGSEESTEESSSGSDEELPPKGVTVVAENFRDAETFSSDGNRNNNNQQIPRLSPNCDVGDMRSSKTTKKADDIPKSGEN